MNNKTTSVVIGVIIIALAAILVFKPTPDIKPTGKGGGINPSASPTVSSSDSGGSTSGATSGTYTLADVAKHNNQASCWTTIGGNVYNLTTWIAQHPGGEGAILSICGKDGTSAFEGQHSDDSKPQQILATFKIGTLVK